MTEQKIDILIVNPLTFPSKFGEHRFVPIAALSILSYITQETKYSVRLINGFKMPDYKEKVLELARNARIVGFSTMTAAIPDVFDLSKKIKELNPEVIIVWGGKHPTLYAEQTIASPFVDYIIMGDGEDSFLELCRELLDRKKPRAQKIRGIIGVGSKLGGKVVLNRNPGVFDMNKLERYDYSVLEEDYFSAGETVMNTSKGCPYRCTFCINHLVSSGKCSAMPAEKLIKELEYLVNVVGLRYIWFTDENFFLNKDRIVELCKLIKEKKLKFTWQSNCRADYFRKGFIDLKFLRMLKRSGCHELNFGFESGSQRVLDMIRKQIKVEDMINVVTLCKKAGIAVGASFMTGIPGEEYEDTLKTMKLIGKLFSIGSGYARLPFNFKDGKGDEYVKLFDVTGPQVFRPYPGGEIYRDLLKKGLWSEPDTLEGWVKFFENTERYDMSKYGWLKMKNTYRMLQYYKTGYLPFSDLVFKMQHVSRSPIIKILNIITYPWFRLRCTLGWFTFPFEIGIIKFIDSRIIIL